MRSNDCHFMEHDQCTETDCTCECHRESPKFECTDCHARFPSQQALDAHLNFIKSGNILTEAAKVISGPRRESYGPVEESFTAVATVANSMLRRKLSSPLDGKDVAMFMLAMKLCREANAHSRDNLVDLRGYAALLEQLHSSESSLSTEGGEK